MLDKTEIHHKKEKQIDDPTPMELTPINQQCKAASGVPMQVYTDRDGNRQVLPVQGVPADDLVECCPSVGAPHVGTHVCDSMAGAVPTPPEQGMFCSFVCPLK